MFYYHETNTYFILKTKKLGTTTQIVKIILKKKRKMLEASHFLIPKPITKLL